MLNNPNIPWLELPPLDMGPWPGTPLQYGAGKVAARYCGLQSTPRQLRGWWMHGWISPHLFVDPRYVAEECSAAPRHVFRWVNNEVTATYLRANGFMARGIGLPISYAAERHYSRRAGSLLVMPGHSTFHSKDGWNFGDCAKAISGFKEQFSEVIVCLHAACLKHGLWVREFQEVGIPVIQGADANDRNSLERIRALMSQFEFVTMNSFGSAFVYACAYGAKASFCDPFCEPTIEGRKQEPFYLDNPGLLETIMPLLGASTIRKHYARFFCHPRAAIEATDWGLREIGYYNRLSPSDLKRAFGWTIWDRCGQRLVMYVHRARRRLRASALSVANRLALRGGA